MQLTWPDELKSFLEQEAEKAGYSSVDDFTLQTFLNANASNSAVEDLDLTEASSLNAEDLEREKQLRARRFLREIAEGRSESDRPRA